MAPGRINEFPYHCPAVPPTQLLDIRPQEVGQELEGDLSTVFRLLVRLSVGCQHGAVLWDGGEVLRWSTILNGLVLTDHTGAAAAGSVQGITTASRRWKAIIF